CLNADAFVAAQTGAALLPGSAALLAARRSGCAARALTGRPRGPGGAGASTSARAAARAARGRRAAAGRCTGGGGCGAARIDGARPRGAAGRARGWSAAGVAGIGRTVVVLAAAGDCRRRAGQQASGQETKRG